MKTKFKITLLVITVCISPGYSNADDAEVALLKTHLSSQGL